MGDRRLTSKERRQEILEAALEIIFFQGFYHLTIKNIAQKIRLTEAAIYRHFNNKKEIIDCLVDLVFEKNQIEDQGGHPAILLKNIIHQRIQEFKNNPKITAITFQEEIFSAYPDIRDRFQKHWQSNEEIIKKIVLRGQREGIFHQDVDPNSFVLIYLGSIRMIVYKWKRDNFSDEIEIMTANVIRGLLKILLNEEICDIF